MSGSPCHAPVPRPVASNQCPASRDQRARREALRQRRSPLPRANLCLPKNQAEDEDEDERSHVQRRSPLPRANLCLPKNQAEDEDEAEMGKS
jgi:hypothetical protein